MNVTKLQLLEKKIGQSVTKLKWQSSRIVKNIENLKRSLAKTTSLMVLVPSSLVHLKLSTLIKSIQH